MRTYWCKNCKKYVEIKKDYKSAKICGIIYLIAIIIGTLAFFPYGVLFMVFGLPLILILFTNGEILRILGGGRACIICGKRTKRH